MDFKLALTGAAVCCAVAGSVLADTDDIGVVVINGRIVTGAIQQNPVTLGQWVTPGARVFGGDLDDTGFAQEPGLSGSALTENGTMTFPAGGRLGFNILAPLSVWTGDGFGATTARINLQFASGAQSATTPVTGGGPVPGFFVNTGPSGEFDIHLDKFITDAAGTGLPGAGVYLLEIELLGQNASGTPLITSDPLFIVFNFGADESAHAAAMDWAEANLAPSPGTAAGLALAGIAACRRRRL